MKAAVHVVQDLSGLVAAEDDPLWAVHVVQGRQGLAELAKVVQGGLHMV